MNIIVTRSIVKQVSEHTSLYQAIDSSCVVSATALMPLFKDSLIKNDSIPTFTESLIVEDAFLAYRCNLVNNKIEFDLTSKELYFIIKFNNADGYYAVSMNPYLMNSFSNNNMIGQSLDSISLRDLGYNKDEKIFISISPSDAESVLEENRQYKKISGARMISGRVYSMFSTGWIIVAISRQKDDCFALRFNLGEKELLKEALQHIYTDVCMKYKGRFEFCSYAPRTTVGMLKDLGSITNYIDVDIDDFIVNMEEANRYLKIKK